MNNVLATLGPVVLGITLGLATRAKFSASVRKNFSDLLELAALKVLLPSLVLDSLSKTKLELDSVFAVVIGFLLPILTFVLLSALQRISAFKRASVVHSDELRFMTSTFGGGSRGTALISLMFAGAITMPHYMKWFALVDLGNFICLLLVIGVLVRKKYSKDRSADGWATLRRFFGSYLFITLIVCLIYLLVRDSYPQIDSYLEESVHQRKIVFSAIVFWAIILRFESAGASTFYSDLLALFIARALCGFTILSISWWFGVPAPILVAVIVLLLMPPSSTLPSMLSDAGANQESRAYVSTFTGGVNIVYLFLVALAFAIAISNSAPT